MARSRSSTLASRVARMVAALPLLLVAAAGQAQPLGTDSMARPPVSFQGHPDVGIVSATTRALVRLHAGADDARYNTILAPTLGPAGDGEPLIDLFNTQLGIGIDQYRARHPRKDDNPARERVFDPNRFNGSADYGVAFPKLVGKTLTVKDAVVVQFFMVSASYAPRPQDQRYQAQAAVAVMVHQLDAPGSSTLHILSTTVSDPGTLYASLDDLAQHADQANATLQAAVSQLAGFAVAQLEQARLAASFGPDNKAAMNSVTRDFGAMDNNTATRAADLLDTFFLCAPACGIGH